MLDLPVDWGWCGGCGTGLRRLTEDEARRLLVGAADRIHEGHSAIEIIEALAWPIEIDAATRSSSRGECQCQLVPRLLADVPAAGFHLYRIWSPDGRLVYVGVSTRLRARLLTHKRQLKELYHEATWDEYADAASMLDAETRAIQDEHPALNKAKV